MKSPELLMICLRRYNKITQPILWNCINLIFPPRCVNCGSLGIRLCDRCSSKIEWIYPPLCVLCGQPSSLGLNHTCIDTKYISKIRAAALFSGPIRKSLHLLKYRRDQSLADFLVRLVFPHWDLDFKQQHAIVPVPLSKQRERLRGYNQSLLISQVLSEITGIPLERQILFRSRETRSQVGLTYGERQKNIRDAFTSIPVKGKKVLLVDDVCTTSATLQSCGKALHDAGADDVSAIVIARAVQSFLPQHHLSLDPPIGGIS